MSHVRLGHLEVFSMVEVYRVGGGVERRGDEWCRAGTSNDGYASGAVYLDEWLVFCRARLSFFVG